MPFPVPTGWAKASAAVLVACFAGCAAETNHGASATHVDSASSQNNIEQAVSTAKEITKVATKKKLILSKRNDADLLVRVGTLQFNEANQATLSTEGLGPSVDKLKQDWKEVSSKPELTWKMSVPDEINGERVTRIIGETVRPGEDNYIYAVLNTLERSYGYKVEMGD